MPAQSQQEKKFMWLVHGVQKGKIPSSKVGDKVSSAANSMDEKDVDDFLMDECGIRECGPEPKIRILKALKEMQEPMNLETQERGKTAWPKSGIAHGPDKPKKGESYWWKKPQIKLNTPETGHNKEITEVEEEDSPDSVASTKTFHGDFKKTLAMYRGFEFTPKENQAIQNFDTAKPNIHDKFKVGYSKADDYGNTTLIIVKKLKESDGQYVYVALVKNRTGEETTPESEPEIPEPEAGEKPSTAAGTAASPNKEPQLQEAMEEVGTEEGDEIKIIKSTPIDDSEGSEILTNFLQSIYHKDA